MKHIATPWHRLIAYLVDILFVIGIQFSIIYLLFQTNSPVDLFNNMLIFLVFSLFSYPILFFLIGWMIEKFGGSLGKLLTGIEIVNEHKKYIPFWQALFRQLVGYAVSGILFYLGFVWVFIDKQRQGWHDMMAGTFVVVKKPSWIWVGLATLAILLVLDIWLGQQIVSKFFEFFGPPKDLLPIF